METTPRLPAEAAKKLLDARARALARVPQQPRKAGETIEVLAFDLAGARFAVESSEVRQIIRLAEWTSVPGVPEVFVGVLSLRGEILAVADLRKLFGLEARPLTDQSRIVVLGGNRAELGLLAEAVQGIETLAIAELMEAPGTASSPYRSSLRGMSPDGLIVLDCQALLDDERLTLDHGPLEAEGN